MKSQFLVKMKVGFQTLAKKIWAYTWCCWKDLNEYDVTNII
jgi:hypothetical protein